MFLDVIGYEGKYQVNEQGIVINSNGEVKNQHVSKGYKRVQLQCDGAMRNKRVHRLVAEAFISNPLGYPQVAHIDGDKDNNHVTNLRWCSNLLNSTWFATTNPSVVNSGNKPKPVLVNGVYYPSAYLAAKYIALNENRNAATVSKEIRRYLNGVRPTNVFYGKYVIEKV